MFTPDNQPLPIGTATEWGSIEGIAFTGGERYYFMRDEDGGVAMVPAFMVERANVTGDGHE